MGQVRRRVGGVGGGASRRVGGVGVGGGVGGGASRRAVSGAGVASRRGFRRGSPSQGSRVLAREDLG